MREGWQQKTLDELCHVVRGGSPRPIQDFLTSSGDGVNWVKISDATASGKYIYETKEKIRPEGVARSRRVGPGDFLLSNSMSFGRPYIMRTSGCVHDGWLVLSDKSGEFDQDYLYYFLSSTDAYRQFDQLAAGSTVRNLNIESAKKVRVPLPPLSEQRRIVAILEEASEGIDTAIANAEKNLANARELFDSYVTSVFAQRGRDWCEKKLGDICENLDSRRIPITKSERIKGDVPYYGASGIVDHVSGHIFDENVLLISEDGANLLARTYPIAFSVSGKSWVNNHAHVVRFDYIGFQKLVELYLNSISLSPYVSGMAQPKLNQKSLNSIPVPVPPIAEQLRIVKTAEAFQNSVERLEEIYRGKLDSLAELKQVVLQNAFAGELTAQSVEAVPEAAE